MAQDEISALLAAHREGSLTAFDRLVELLYDELRRLARARARAGASGTLSPTVLLHETYLRMRREPAPAWQDRSHFLAIAARAMRRVLVDHARAAHARKRGGGSARVTLDAETLGSGGETATADLLDLERGIQALQAIDARLCRVAECRLFAGLSPSETALALGVPLRTVERDWQRARAWLRKELGA